MFLSITASAQTTVSTFAGTKQPYTFSNADNGNPSSFYFPYAITATPDGSLYVVEKESNFIRKITPQGTVSLFAGDATFRQYNSAQPNLYQGYIDQGNVDGTLQNAKFNSILGIASDSNGVIYVADTYNHSIRKIVGNNVSTFPTSLCVDSNGVMYVTDGNCVKRITPSGAVTIIAGATSQGNVNGGLLTARFRSLTHIALDEAGNTLYVSDSDNSALRKINLTTQLVSTMTVSTVEAGNTYTLVKPTGVVYKAGSLYVNDVAGNIIYKVTGVTTVRWAGNGRTRFRDGLSTTTVLGATFINLEGLAIDNNGNGYAVDLGNARIRKITN